MTREEQKRSRMICDAATAGPWKIDKLGRYEDHDECHVRLADDDITVNDFIVEGCRYENAEFISHARTALPAALDALDKMEIALDTARQARPYELTGDAARSLFLIAELGEAGDACKRMRIERDSWQARAEALESVCRGECELCVHENVSVNDPDGPCFDYSLTDGADSRFTKCEHWEFDEERFAGGAS